MRIAIRFAYDGRRFQGYGRIPGKKTVEGVMLEALRSQDEKAMLKSGSRTDRGVSALANVAVVETEGELDFNWLNAKLRDIWITGFVSVDENFRPRCAEWRWYRYFFGDPTIDVEKARECGSLFVGTHDFRNFARPDHRKTIRTIYDVKITAYRPPEFPLAITVMDIRGRSFLWNMIRRIARVVMDVGMGKLDLEQVREAIEKPLKRRVFGSMPPEPLVLMKVHYRDLAFRRVRLLRSTRREIALNFHHDLAFSFLAQYLLSPGEIWYPPDLW